MKRTRIESVVLDPLRKDLLAPERVKRMAAEMQATYAEHVQAFQTRATERPNETAGARLTTCKAA